jgi:hypothetical protein
MVSRPKTPPKTPPKADTTKKLTDLIKKIEKVPLMKIIMNRAGLTVHGAIFTIIMSILCIILSMISLRVSCDLFAVSVFIHTKYYIDSFYLHLEMY